MRRKTGNSLDLARASVLNCGMKSRLVEIRHGDMRALVYPERGFQLYGFERDFGQGDSFPAIYAPSLDAEPEQRRYGNPVLFPCCGISSHAEGTDLWLRAGKTWPMPGHGFARNHYWRILDAREDRVAAALTPTPLPTRPTRVRP